MARLPFETLDAAVIDAMGENLSRAGMDTKVRGRMMMRGGAEFARPRIADIAVLDGTDGNAVGVGLADFIRSGSWRRSTCGPSTSTP